MYLADITIKKYMQNGMIEIIPDVSEADIRPVGIRIHIDKNILVPHPSYVDLSAPADLEYESIDIEKDKFVLKPGGFMLASTIEKIKTSPRLVAFLDGRSTIARLGLTVHVTSGALDGNYDEARTVTLEIKNLGEHSIRLNKNDAVGQFMFASLSDEIQQKSQSQYANQDGVVPPNLSFRPGVDR